MKREAMFYTRLQNTKVRCDLCAHHCVIKDQDYGFCSVRRNISGTLYTHVFGETIARNIDPIEKNPCTIFCLGARPFP
jgi:pyruvate formate lyase activating enzyme